MNAPRRLPLVVSVVNGVGFIGYLVWLADRGRRVFFDPQGVMDLLPCIAFLFVFACLAWQARRGGGEPDRHPAAEAHNQSTKSE